jgi:hypothetical protein
MRALVEGGVDIKALEKDREDVITMRPARTMSAWSN